MPKQASRPGPLVPLYQIVKFRIFTYLNQRGEDIAKRGAHLRRNRHKSGMERFLPWHDREGVVCVLCVVCVVCVCVVVCCVCCLRCAFVLCVVCCVFCVVCVVLAPD